MDRPPVGVGATLAGWTFSQSELASAKSGERMINPSMDLGNPCNLNCPYCFIEEKGSTRKVRRQGELTHLETFNLIEEFASAGALTVNIVGAGEPTVDPVFKEVVERITERGMTPVVFTNGIKLAKDQSLAQFLFDRKVTIVLKFNALTANIQDRLVGKRGYTTHRNSALKNLLRTGFASVTPTRLAFDSVATQGNLNELPALHAFARTRNIYPLIADFIPTGRTEAGRFTGEAALVSLPRGERQEIVALLQPLTLDQRHWLSGRLEKADALFGIKQGGIARAYYTGQRCTQSLGLYVDIVGKVWPCVARAKVQRGRLTSGQLGDFRAGDKLATLWRQDPYMVWLRASYDGGCPYKPTVSSRIAPSETVVQIGVSTKEEVRFG